MKEVVFVSAVRTGVGRYSLANEIVHKMVTNFRNSPLPPFRKGGLRDFEGFPD